MQVAPAVFAGSEIALEKREKCQMGRITAVFVKIK